MYSQLTPSLDWNSACKTIERVLVIRNTNVTMQQSLLRLYVLDKSSPLGIESTTKLKLHLCFSGPTAGGVACGVAIFFSSEQGFHKCWLEIPWRWVQNSEIFTKIP